MGLFVYCLALSLMLAGFVSSGASAPATVGRREGGLSTCPPPGATIRDICRRVCST